MRAAPLDAPGPPGPPPTGGCLSSFMSLRREDGRGNMRRSVSPFARLAFTTVSPAPEGLQQVFVEGVNEWVGES